MGYGVVGSYHGRTNVWGGRKGCRNNKERFYPAQSDPLLAVKIPSYRRQCVLPNVTRSTDVVSPQRSESFRGSFLERAKVVFRTHACAHTPTDECTR